VRGYYFNLAKSFYNVWVVVNLELRDRYGLAERGPVTADDILDLVCERLVHLHRDRPERREWSGNE
jgi:hypothetical protein